MPCPCSSTETCHPARDRPPGTELKVAHRKPQGPRESGARCNWHHYVSMPCLVSDLRVCLSLSCNSLTCLRLWLVQTPVEMLEYSTHENVAHGFDQQRGTFFHA